ncbi:hypothetical protein BFP97_00715 [Roseivirga sp. 4D4]|uniref:hypothetical protein n=1 Tax=Roseivirga sp. 4D4 TaxID=1889784 RepID=UPI000853578E|nr:hypothetical protein [Roseivirga sp. 4D4]OEK00124.1 hypothetical protein BFP97_00715 [Roseivirga sp. 4D4]
MKKLRFISPLIAVVFALGVYSCDNEEGADPALDDDALIAAIEVASNKVEVDAATLPPSSVSIIESDFSESEVSSVAMAPDLGFSVTLMRASGTRVGEIVVIFFDLTGRELRSIRDFLSRRRKRRQARDCFDFVFPFSVTVPDGTSITLESKSDWRLVRTWYKENPDADARPSFDYPIDILYGDTVITINNKEELIRARASCEVDTADGRCFAFNFPISFIMPDESDIVLESRADWTLIRQWYRANPDAEGRPDLVYPVDITFQDGTTVTVNSDEEMLRARETCDN